MAKLVRGDTNQGREEREKEIGSWRHKPRQRRKRKGNWFVGTQTKAEKKEKRKLVRGDTNQGGVGGHKPRRYMLNKICNLL